jgi:hypothetical protein
MKEALPFQSQPLLSDLYYHKDLLDFSAAGEPTQRSLDKANIRSIFPTSTCHWIALVFSSFGSCRCWSSSYLCCFAFESDGSE